MSMQWGIVREDEENEKEAHKNKRRNSFQVAGRGGSKGEFQVTSRFFAPIGL